MPSYSTLAIVLRRLHYGETDNILTLYSPEHGRFSAIAKGARKAISRLSGATEALTCTRFGLASGKSLEIVTQVEVEDSFPGLRQDLYRLAHGLYFADLVDHAVEDHAPNPALFDLLHTVLSLTRTVTPVDLVARWFELHLLRDLGYAPVLSECMICHTPLPGDFAEDEVFALSALLGGALCPRHARPATDESHSALSYEALWLLQTLDAAHDFPSESVADLGSDLATLSTKSLNQTRLALRRTLRFHIERDLKSLEFLDSLRDIA